MCGRVNNSQMFWLLVLLLLLVLLVRAKPGHQSMRQTCEREVCTANVLDESANCVLKCMSPKCFHKLYAGAPLENGEVDDRRRAQFQACVAAEERQEKNWIKRQTWTGSGNVSPEEIALPDSDWEVGL